MLRAGRQEQVSDVLYKRERSPIQALTSDCVDHKPDLLSSSFTNTINRTLSYRRIATPILHISSQYSAAF